MSFMQTYQGSCHCGAVTFEVNTDLADTMVCNCSYCQKRGLILHFVDKDKVRMLAGEENLESYLFHTKTINHLFCRTCGVQAFGRNDAYPKMMINVRCLEGVDVAALSPKPYNGRDR